MHNMGQKTVREVLAKLDGLRDRFIPVSSSPSDENNLWYSVAQDFSSLFTAKIDPTRTERSCARPFTGTILSGRRYVMPCSGYWRSGRTE